MNEVSNVPDSSVKWQWHFTEESGIHQGIKDASNVRGRKFRVGDHVRMKYRGQEGTVVDISGDLYMV